MSCLIRDERCSSASGSSMLGKFLLSPNGEIEQGQYIKLCLFLGFRFLYLNSPTKILTARLRSG